MTDSKHETRTRQRAERTLVIDFDLSHGLLAVLLVAAVVVAAVALMRGPAPASAADEQALAADGMRRFYLAPAVPNATQAIGGCETGYHFASLWEILDTSNFSYDTALGVLSGDSASGPPAGYEGWVRTGYVANSGTTPGQANCSAWGATTGNGTTVRLPSDWATGAELHVWDVGIAACGTPAYIWCVED